MELWMLANSGYSRACETSLWVFQLWYTCTHIWWWELTKREELSFLVVCAFPNASKTGLDKISKFLTFSTSLDMGVMLAKYLMMIFEASVFPAPLSPISHYSLALQCVQHSNTQTLTNRIFKATYSFFTHKERFMSVPVMMMEESLLNLFISWYAASATAYTWGGRSNTSFPR